MRNFIAFNLNSIVQPPTPLPSPSSLVYPYTPVTSGPIFRIRRLVSPEKKGKKQTGKTHELLEKGKPRTDGKSLRARFLSSFFAVFFFLRQICCPLQGGKLNQAPE